MSKITTSEQLIRHNLRRLIQRRDALRFLPAAGTDERHAVRVEQLAGLQIQIDALYNHLREV